MKTFKIYNLVIIAALLGSCIEPFYPEIKEYDDLLVVEALITDNPSSQFVKLSRSYPLDTSLIIAETGASVMLSDSDGNLFQFLEGNRGIYAPLPNTFFPDPGSSYQLSIITATGKEYHSAPVLMKETPPIENLYFERAALPSEETGDLDDGLQILVNTGTQTSEPGFYKFDWEETWELITPYYSFFDFDFQSNEIIERENNINNCWADAFSTNLNIASSESLSLDNIKSHPIRFIPFRDPILKIKYSILVKQYAISEDSYRFWQNLKESNESTGSLYDAQPFQVTGNIRNINDPEEPVLGFFEMATLSTKRIFISGQDDIPDDVRIPSFYTQCLVGADTIISESNVPTFLNTGYLISRELLGVGFEMVVRSCIDCRLKGENMKPEFWE